MKSTNNFFICKHIFAKRESISDGILVFSSLTSCLEVEVQVAVMPRNM